MEPVVQPCTRRANCSGKPSLQPIRRRLQRHPNRGAHCSFQAFAGPEVLLFLGVHCSLGAFLCSCFALLAGRSRCGEDCRGTGIAAADCSFGAFAGPEVLLFLGVHCSLGAFLCSCFALLAGRSRCGEDCRGTGIAGADCSFEAFAGPEVPLFLGVHCSLGAFLCSCFALLAGRSRCGEDCRGTGIAGADCSFEAFAGPEVPLFLGVHCSLGAFLCSCFALLTGRSRCGEDCRGTGIAGADCSFRAFAGPEVLLFLGVHCSLACHYPLLKLMQAADP